MRIGVVREIKDHEYRVALAPRGAERLTDDGHSVWVDVNAGAQSGFTNQMYEAAGARIVSTEMAWAADLVVKVKEPEPSEYWHFNGQVIFAYLHLAGVPASLTEALLSTATTAIAYETVEDSGGRLPLLEPMSAIAGVVAAQVGARYLAKPSGGKGVLLAELRGQRQGKVVVIGDGVVGRHAARTALRMGAAVTLFGRHANRFDSLKNEVGAEAQVLVSSEATIAEQVQGADVVIGAVLAKGARAPRVVTERMVRTMEGGSVIVDVSIDQGGCVETSRPTTHSDPVFVRHGVTHYCVPNMPGAYPRTATLALNEATLPYILTLARKGLEAVKVDEGLAKGVNTYNGYITCRPVADALGLSSRYRQLQVISNLD